jgi:uncharacterized membrane protein YqaE (UPF0057 family)
MAVCYNFQFFECKHLLFFCQIYENKQISITFAMELHSSGSRKALRVGNPINLFSMKQLFILFLFFVSFQANAYVNHETIQVQGFDKAVFSEMSISKFMALTPVEITTMTGQKLTLKQTISLKAAQKHFKHQSPKGDMSDTTAIILVILLGFIGMWIYQGEWNKYVLNTLLWSLLCGIPGIIYGIKVIKGKV